MSAGEKNRSKSAIPIALIAGGFVWIVFDSLFFGGLAGVLTFVLMKRDAAEEDHDRDG